MPGQSPFVALEYEVTQINIRLDAVELLMDTLCTAANGRIDDTEDALALVASDLDDLEIVVNALEIPDIGTLTSDVSTLQSDMSTAQGAISTAESAISTAEGEIDTLQSEMTTAQGDIGDIQASIGTPGEGVTLETVSAAAESSKGWLRKLRHQI